MISVDKQGHAWAGGALFLGLSLLIGNGVSGAIAAIAAGVLREVTGNRDMGDFLATVFGICCAIPVWWWGTK